MNPCESRLVAAKYAAVLIQIKYTTVVKLDCSGTHRVVQAWNEVARQTPDEQTVDVAGSA